MPEDHHLAMIAPVFAANQDGKLIDAVIAVVMPGEQEEESDLLVEHLAYIAVTELQLAVDRPDNAAAQLVLDTDNLTEKDTHESDEVEAEWLSDEILYLVFG